MSDDRMTIKVKRSVADTLIDLKRPNETWDGFLMRLVGALPESRETTATVPGPTTPSCARCGAYLARFRLRHGETYCLDCVNAAQPTDR